MRYFNALAFLISAFLLNAAIIPHQGRVLFDGSPVDGYGYFQFALVDQTGVIRWNHLGRTDKPQPDEILELRVKKGFYQCKLGDISIPGMEPLSDSLFFYDTPLSLRVWFSNSPEKKPEQLGPDQPLLIAPYAISTLWKKSDDIATLFSEELEEQAGDHGTTSFSLIERIVSSGTNTLAVDDFNGTISPSMLDQVILDRFVDIESNLTESNQTLTSVITLLNTHIAAPVELSNIGETISSELQVLTDGIAQNITNLEDFNDTLFLQKNRLDSNVLDIDNLLDENQTVQARVSKNTELFKQNEKKILTLQADLETLEQNYTRTSEQSLALHSNLSKLEIRLLAHLRPQIHGILPSSVSLEVGDTLSLKVDVDGRELSYQWQKGETPIPDANSSIFEKANVKLDDNGTYTIVIKNYFGEDSKAVNVLVSQ